MDSAPRGKAIDAAEHSWSIDSIEAGVVRVEEDGAHMLTVPSHQLPSGIKEGQLLRVSRSTGSDGGILVHSAVIDAVATRAALDASAKRTAEIATEARKNDRGGDVVL